ncbi:MAG: M48 family metalloprotease, partial [Hyphomicrobiaceae bacterium]
MRRAALFGHIQRNNLKSLALLAAFLCLIEASQIAIRLVPAAIGVSFMTRLNPAWHFDNSFMTVRPGRTPDGPRFETIVTKRATDDGFGAIWQRLASQSRFFERDWYLILIIGAIYIALACWRSVVLMRYETGARPVDRKDAPDLYNLVENLAISTGLPCPRIELIESDKLNAYAAGFFPKASTIAVTRGLIRKLSRDELEAVLAHELVHIRDRDVRLMVVARACVDLVLPISRLMIDFVRAHPIISALLGLQLFFLVGPAFALILAIAAGAIALLALGAR